VIAVNPSRVIQKIAVQIISAHVGNTGTVTDLSETNDPEFRIDYANGCVAIGEVAWHPDPLRMRLQEALERYGRRAVLAPGTGRWRVWIKLAAKVKNLPARLPPLIERYAVTNERIVQIQDSWPIDDRADDARRLGVEHIRWLSQGPDEVLYDQAPYGDMIPDDPIRASSSTGWTRSWSSPTTTTSPASCSTCTPPSGASS
jgi:hypothetical protein